MEDSKKTKILIIEDEHFISELYTRALSRAGYDVRVVVDGEAGLVAAQSNEYDIVLLDIMVPNLTGTEILKQLRDPSVTPTFDAKVIITTNLEQSEEGKEQIQSLADGYIIKADVTPHQLVDFLQQL